MHRILITSLATAALIFGYIAPGSATPLLIIGGGSPGSIPIGAAHDVPETNGAVGFYNANLYATDSTDLMLTYEYLGFEAGWTNTFLVDGEQVFWNKDYGVNSASFPGDQVFSSANAGSLLDFAFEILVGGNAGYGVVNGSNVEPFGVDVDPGDPNNNYGSPNFFLGYVEGTNENSVYITLDDGGGGPWFLNSLDDDNHDDLVVKVTAIAVPEPASAVLLGSGLVGLALFKRKFRV